MPEAEDVLIGAARHGTAYAMALWRRRRAQRAVGPGLDDVRPRLEMLIQAVYARAIRVRVSAVPPPPTLLQRLFHSERPAHPRVALPATDGVSIYLPARFAGADGPLALEYFRISALQQAMRLARGTALHYPHEAPGAVQDWYLVAEAAAADRAVVRLLPGCAGALDGLRRHTLHRRQATGGSDVPAGSVEAAYRALLQSAALDLPATLIDAPSPEDALAWAHAKAARAGTDRYRPLPSDVLLGAIWRAEGERASPRAADAGRAEKPQVASMGRRPRVREARPDEDDDQPGAWMVQTTEPSEHVEDPFGLQRPLDQGEEPDVDGLSESVSEMEQARLVSAPGTPREVLVAEDGLPDVRSASSPAESHADDVLVYPEWDYRLDGYRAHGATVRVAPLPAGDPAWGEAVLKRHQATLRSIRRRFEALRGRRAVLHQQSEGDEIDLEAYVRSLADVRAQQPREDRLYIVHRPARPEFALTLLVDTSASTDAWISANERIIDVEKEALVIVATALDALRVDYSIQAFSGHGPEEVRVAPVKSFDERGVGACLGRIAALQPDEYTRLGAALRHAAATLMRRPAARRLLLLLSDGKPNDCDEYDGRYGVEDLRQALAEARAQGVDTYCVTVDRRAGAHLGGLFGVRNHSIVHEPRRLAAALLEWLRHAAAAVR